MALKPNMYVRTKKGIAKYLGLGKNVLTINESNQFKYYANRHLFDNRIFDVRHDWGDTLSNEEFNNIDKYIEKNPSFDLIDLIEVGDYVNGYKIEKIQAGENYCYLLEDDDPWTLIAGYDCDGLTIPIKSIVTKEQFEAMKYVVERNE